MDDLKEPIKGLGNDIIEVNRIEEVLERHGQKFLDKLFTPKEQAYCAQYRDHARRLAGRFAAKEAIVKALGTGFSPHVAWRDIEILNDREGKPYVILSQRVKEHFNHPRLYISISHCRAYATAVAIYY